MMILGSRLEVRHLPSVVLKENGSPEDPAEARSLSAARLAFDRDYIPKKLEESGETFPVLPTHSASNAATCTESSRV